MCLKWHGKCGPSGCARYSRNAVRHVVRTGPANSSGVGGAVSRSRIGCASTESLGGLGE